MIKLNISTRGFKNDLMSGPKCALNIIELEESLQSTFCSSKRKWIMLLNGLWSR